MKKQNTKKHLQFFLTKSQIKDVNKAKRDKTKYTLLLPYKQLKKTCPDIIRINNKMEELKKERNLINPPKVVEKVPTQTSKAKKKMQDLFDYSMKESAKKEKFLDKIYKNTLKKYMKPTKISNIRELL